MLRLRSIVCAGLRRQVFRLRRLSSNGISSFGNDYVDVTFGIAKLDTVITNSITNEVRYQYGRDFEFEYRPDAYCV